jgi:arginine N-succinyltransferase
MLMASAPQRFGSQVVSELRGVVDADGASPFWEHLGRKFFRMSFAEADRLSATTDNQFILDLMPKYPIYADLLPEAARAVIGACHVDGQGAKRLLEWEGFRFADVVDIFDGGPLMVAPRDGIRTVREARRLRVRAGSVTDGRRGLVATPWRADFRCAPTHVTVSEEEAIVDPATLEALGLAPSDEAIVWVDHGR